MGSNSFVRLVGVVLWATPFLAFAQADLRTTASTSNQFVTQTRPATISFTVVNNGPSVATGVVLANTTAFPGTNVSLTVPGSCPLVVTGPPAAPTLTWTIGALASGQATTCTFDIRALATSQNLVFRLAMRVTSTSVDPVPNNNSAGIDLSISAIDVVSDISLSVTVAPPEGLLPIDGTARIYVTLRNLGPDNAAITRVASNWFPVPFVSPPPFLIFGVPEDPCQTFIDSEGGQFQVSTGPPGGFAAGSSITCVLGVERATASSIRTYSLTWLSGAGGPGFLDPDLSNNTASIVLGISDPPVPVPAVNALGIALLLVGLGIALRVARV